MMRCVRGLAHAVATVCALMTIGCDNVQRSMVFMTGTMVGIDVAVQPQGDSPLHATVGYKRAEVLFDPIMEDVKGGGAEGSKTKYVIKDQAHSVMAKLLGDTNVSAKSGAGPETAMSGSVSQWFASGKAAEILASSGGAAALTDNPAVAKAVAETGKGFGAGLSQEQRVVFPQVIDSIHRSLVAIGATDAEAARLAADLNANLHLDLGLPQSYNFTKYARASGATTVAEEPPVPAHGAIAQDLSGVTAYHDRLHKSVAGLKTILKVAELDPSLLTPPTGKTFASLRAELAQQTVMLDALERNIAQNERLRKAAGYLMEKLGGAPKQ